MIHKLINNLPSNSAVTENNFPGQFGHHRKFFLWWPNCDFNCPRKHIPSMTAKLSRRKILLWQLNWRIEGSALNAPSSPSGIGVKRTNNLINLQVTKINDPHVNNQRFNDLYLKINDPQVNKQRFNDLHFNGRLLIENIFGQKQIQPNTPLAKNCFGWSCLGWNNIFWPTCFSAGHFFENNVFWPTNFSAK